MTDRPYFLWDYDFTEEDVRRMLREGDETTKLWLIARILQSASYKDVFKYLTVKQIIEYFPRLRMRPTMKKYWHRALSTWGYHV